MQTQKVYKECIKKSKVLNVYTVAAASSILGVSLKSIYKWIEQGRLAEVSIAGGDIRLIDGKSVESMKTKLALHPVKRSKQSAS